MGSLAPGLPGVLVNAGTPTVTVRGHTRDTCGRAPDATLHLWAAEPTWYQAATRDALGTHAVDAARVEVTRDEATGTTDTEVAASVPASGESWVGVRYRIPDAATRLGRPVSHSGLAATRIVVRTPPTIDPLPAVLPHDNGDTTLTGTAWPGDTVRVGTPTGRLICETFAEPDGRWTCPSTSFPHGATEITVRQVGAGPNNPAYPGLDSTGLPDQTGNVVRTRVITADPAVLVEVDNGTPSVGETVTYTVTAVNLGPDTAAGVGVVATLPAGVRYVSSTATAGTFDPATGAWTGIGDLGPMARRELTISGRVVAEGSYTLSATISATGATDGVGTSRLRGADGVADWNLNAANDTDAAVVATAPSADPRLLKRVSRPVSQVGDIVRYTLVATNAGPDTATDVVVYDPLPRGLEFVSARSNVGLFDERTNRWTIGDLPTTVTARLVLRTRVVRQGVIRNAATVRAGGARRGAASGPDANTDVTNDASVAVITVR
ncbi:hypothetical protein GCM10009682_57190 [Luedemannella flava]|uniref:DUF11 domain-containing protein n=2 Tax=Luedemannella flava TaxID=349316 RepID=A0ABN2MMM1_9ACTN